MICVFRKCHLGARSAIGSIAITSLFLFLVACGDDESSFTSRPGDDSSIETSSSIAQSSSERSGGDPSSSSVKSSSSSVKSSGSSSSKRSAWEYLNPNIDYGEIVDERDGQVYKTVRIGDQVWMAENLNYEVPNSFCYDDIKSNCDIYGRLYRWSAALGKGDDGCRYGENCPLPDGHIQGACPANWHLPKEEEWNKLFSSPIVRDQSRSGFILKANSDLWTSYKGITNTDSVGFSILPGGYLPLYGTNVGYEMETEARFWAFSESEYESLSNDAPCYYFSYKSNGAGASWHDRDLGYSVRCVMDEDKVPPESSSSETSISSSSEDSSSSSAESSSSSINLSSSEEPNSSSSSDTWATECKTETEDNCEYGELVDERDGQVYKTVKIGDQWWMAQNLNYAYLQPTDELDSSSFCYNNSAEYCAKYGRLYLWSAAMDSVGTWSLDGKGCGYGVECSPQSPVRGICPKGWHLPSKNEWNVLVSGLGGASWAGVKLKSISGWKNNGNGTDDYGFTALPVGYMTNIGEYSYEGTDAVFWSSAEVNWVSDDVNSRSAYIKYLSYLNDKALLDYTGKNYGYSVRCIKDSSD